MKIKILHGMSDIAGQGSYSVTGLRSIGENATIAVWAKNPFGYPVDIDLHIDRVKIHHVLYALCASFKMFGFACKASIKYNVFHFHFNHSLVPFGLDLPFLKILKKKIIMEFHGADIRYAYLREEPKYMPYEELPNFRGREKRSIARTLKYADEIITHDEELKRHIPHEKLFIVPLRMNVNRFEPVFPVEEKEKICIVHAPSDYISKGSKYVITAIEKLKDKYDIDFILVEKKTQQEAFEIYKKADIIVDQLFAQTYGVFAIEAMSMGKPVVGWITDEIRATFPKTMPIVSATIENIADVLEYLIKDGKKRRELGIAGRKYVEEYHDYRKIAQVLLDIYTEKIEPMNTLDSFEYAKLKKVDNICVE